MAHTLVLLAWLGFAARVEEAINCGQQQASLYNYKQKRLSSIIFEPPEISTGWETAIGVENSCNSRQNRAGRSSALQPRRSTPPIDGGSMQHFECAVAGTILSIPSPWPVPDAEDVG